MHTTATQHLAANSVIWDAHACMPIRPNQDLSSLERYRQIGASFVSINVRMDFNPLSHIMRVIAGYRDWLARNSDRFVLARSVDDVLQARHAGKLAVAFDLEGSVMLENDLAMLALFRDLGVRQIHLAYNRNNSIAGGCHDVERGLTELGRAVVAEINAVGMLMDCSHSSKTTSMDIMEFSTKPVIFSHANVRALKDHPRNIDYEQIEACARTGGVIGLSGIGIFLGDDDIRVETLLRHVDYLAERVGCSHIGFGLDFSFLSGSGELPPGEKMEQWWPASYGYDFKNMSTMPPERLPDIAEAMDRAGYSGEDIKAILGGNFVRVARQTWTC
ncbi:membrane dipeptidase [Mycoplana sp. BE70]|uniref:dipeptidase n=1 Tax=Mycoplana sp. BE70 TaxID=2817775 RepID=UPI0028650ADB|nr:membrane dipeptidase [Mycoplana sp. BE70]MDR6759467.1 membrane dipeptidase [Mycoplana sp. BE70]